MTVIPTIMLKGRFTRLWDAGYQKFLLTDDGLKLPALATHLQNLRKFNEELRTALGIPTFYNEALGSVSQVSVYDRVKGRKGAVPDELSAHTKPAAAIKVADSRPRDFNWDFQLAAASRSCRRNCSRSTRCFAAFRWPIKITGISQPWRSLRTGSASILTSRRTAPNSLKSGAMADLASSQRWHPGRV